jgi:hypothetical protein
MADNFLKTSTTLVDKATGAVVGKDGFIIASGTSPTGFLTFADGTKLSTAPTSDPIAALGTADIPAAFVIFNGTNPPVISGGTFVSAFAGGKSIATGGKYVCSVKLVIGGGATSFTMGDLEQVVVMVECQVVSSGGGTFSGTFGASATLPSTFGSSTTLPVLTAETLLTLPDPPAGETWNQAQYQVTASSNTALSTSTIGFGIVTVSVFSNPSTTNY